MPYKQKSINMNYKTVQEKKPLALVVDDDLSLRLSMCAALTKAGFEVIEAESGQEAVTCFETIMPDLVLLDVMMPVMNGFETCIAIRNLPGGESTQILMVTGLDDMESIERAFEAGANDFITKPLNWIMLGHRGKYMLRAGRAFQELSRSKQRLAKTQELARLGNWEIDLTTHTFHCSPEACNLLGFNPDEQISYKDFLAPVVARQRDEIKEIINSAIQTKKPFSLHYQVILSDGTLRHILNRGEILFTENGTAERMLGAIQDVTKLKIAEEEIRLLAFYDALTGLANRTLFMDRLGHELSAAERNNSIFALLFLDLDQFKRINDTYGHNIGDLLLKNVSDTLQKEIRSSDTATGPELKPDNMIARFGGDEFIILLSNISAPENAAIVARRIINKIPASYSLQGHDISITTSIGISVFPNDGKDAETLLKHADTAMYHAKDSGRNNYQFFTKSLNTAVKERLSIEKELKQALENEEFLLYYQPKIELSSRKIVGAEALIRWLHPQKGMIPPDKFIPIAEDTGLIIDINKWVIQEACSQSKNWQHADSVPIKIAVNLSGYQLANQNIIQVIKDALLTADINPKNLEIEITENVLMQDTEDTVWILNQIKDLSLKIALDDFGTGYSSLSYLMSFPVDILKIDRSFVMGCTMSPKNLVIIKAIIAMGHSLGMKIVAEGIETEKQLEIITASGADEGQGFYFSPPVPRDEFTKLLARITL